MKTMEDAVAFLKAMSEEQQSESLSQTAYGNILGGRALMEESIGFHKAYTTLVEAFPKMNADDVKPKTTKAKPTKPESKTAKPRTNKPKVKVKK